MLLSLVLLLRHRAPGSENLLESPVPTKDATQLARISSFTAWMERGKSQGPLLGNQDMHNNAGSLRFTGSLFDYCLVWGTNSFGEIKTPDNTHSEWGDRSPCDGGWHIVRVGRCKDVAHPMGKFAYNQGKEGHPTSWFLALLRLK